MWTIVAVIVMTMFIALFLYCTFKIVFSYSAIQPQVSIQVSFQCSKRSGVVHRGGKPDGEKFPVN